MKVLASWVREFAALPDVAPRDLAAALAARGFEVADVTPPPPGLPPRGHAPDAVIDLEVTANRPDCLSVIGIGRELAAAWEIPFQADLPIEAAGLTAARDDLPELAVSVEEPELCPRYAAAVADVRIAPSPGWLAARLLAAGIRPINNIVDVTNYVLIERGHPMHAFDLERLGGRTLRIRRAEAGERIRTLDGEDRALSTDMLVIADATTPQAIAGVMGGAASEVSASTRRVAFESAYFQPASVRRTSKRLGLSTDASYRFERGADISAPLAALARAASLLREIGAGEVRGPFIDRYPNPAGPRRVALRHARVERLLGARLDAGFIERILDRLGFAAIVDTAAPGHHGRVWQVVVPTRRVDVNREADLIEEVARHYGYDRLPTTFPPLVVPPAPPAPSIEQERIVQRALVGIGFSEALTFSFIERSVAQAFGGDAESLVDISNPLSAKFASMRPSLIPGLVESLGYNLRREQRDVQLFEIGRRFMPGGERRSVAVAWAGAGRAEHWSEPRRPVDFFDVKGAVVDVCGVLGAAATLEPGGPSFLVPGRSATIHSSGATIGAVGQLAPGLAETLGAGAADEVYVGELDLDALDTSAGAFLDRAIAPLPRYPSVVRDLAIVIDERLPAAALRGTIRAAAPETLESVHEFDRYQGPAIPAGRLSLAVRLTFRAVDRTLTDTEVQAAVDQIFSALARSHGAALR